jgi:uncharacterized protein
MLLVKTKLKQSEIHGMGIFADQFIPKGTKTWELKHGFDVIMDTQAIDSLSPPVKEKVLIYAYFDVKLNAYVLCSDDSRFMNHSTDPSINSDGTVDIAARDIQVGDELTCDYTKFDSAADHKLF